MNRSAYAFRQVDANLYKFMSEGNERIEKVVEFTTMNQPGVMNLGFGDSADGKVMDDEVISNNGDFAKVMATVVKIVWDYTLAFPETKISFCGSTRERTRFYGRILKTYYAEFARDFDISAIVRETSKEVEFDPAKPYVFDAYFVKRKKGPVCL